MSDTERLAALLREAPKFLLNRHQANLLAEWLIERGMRRIAARRAAEPVASVPPDVPWVYCACGGRMFSFNANTVMCAACGHKNMIVSERAGRAALASASPTEPSEAAMQAALDAWIPQGMQRSDGLNIMRKMLRAAYAIDRVRPASPAPLSAPSENALFEALHFGSSDALPTKRLWTPDEERLVAAEMVKWLLRGVRSPAERTET